MGRESQPYPLFLRKGEGKRRVLLAEGPAVIFGSFSFNSYILYFYGFVYVPIINITQRSHRDMVQVRV